MVEKKQKYVFLQTLLVSALIFSFGMLIGVLVEDIRTIKVDDLYLESQIELTDLRLESEILSNLNFNCEAAIKENINFADRIYEEARSLEKYDESSKVSDKLKVAHKRYDILRTTLWYNSIKIKEKCPEKFHTVVYFYDYIDTEIPQKSKQNVISKVLSELKQKQGADIILIPIATDLDIYSLNLIMNSYNITEFPTILIDEKYKITEISTVQELEKYL